MSARKGSISRVTVPTARVDSLGTAVDGGRGSERPLISALQVVWRGRWIILGCVLLALVAGIIRISTSVPVYHSSATILIQESMPNIIGDALSTSGQTSGYLFTQCEIIKSTAILTKALTQPGVAEAKVLGGLSNPVAFLKASILALPAAEGDLITVSMDATNAADAATIVNGVVSAYTAYQSEQHRQTAGEVIKILQADVDRQESELKAEQLELTNFKKHNPDLILDTGDRGMSPAAMLIQHYSRAQQRTLQFHIALEEASSFSDDALQLKRIVDETNHTVDLPPDTDPVVDPSTLLSIREAEVALRQFNEGESNNPAYTRLMRQREEGYRDKDRQLAAASKRYLAYLNKQYNDSLNEEAQLKKLVDANRASAIESNSKDAEYEQLTAQVAQTQHALYANYDRLRTVNVTSEVGALTVSVLEPARPSTESLGTKRSNAIAMAIVAGLMVGLGLSLLLDMLDQRLRTVEEVSKLLSAPILGAVPRIVAGANWGMPYSFRQFRSAWRRYLLAAWSAIRPSEWHSTQTLMQAGQTMHLQPRSDVAEAYRAVRTSIYFGLSGDQTKTILVTSPASGDGKTTLASNLAIAIAQAGRRVLLIDADCWRPAQHEIFGLGEGNGLTDVLTKRVAIADAIHKTDVDNLLVMPCGELPRHPAELLESPAFAEMLAELSQSYDQILIDSPPVVPITDARILAASCDATILVLRAGKSTRKQTDLAFEVLHAVGAPVLGVVVNDAPRQAHGNSTAYYRYTAGLNRNNWDAYSAPQLAGNRNGNGKGNGHNGNGYASHQPEIIDADPALEAEHTMPRGE